MRGIKTHASKRRNGHSPREEIRRTANGWHGATRAGVGKGVHGLDANGAGQRFDVIVQGRNAVACRFNVVDELAANRCWSRLPATHGVTAALRCGPRNCVQSRLQTLEARLRLVDQGVEALESGFTFADWTLLLELCGRVKAGPDHRATQHATLLMHIVAKLVFGHGLNFLMHLYPFNATDDRGWLARGGLAIPGERDASASAPIAVARLACVSVLTEQGAQLFEVRPGQPLVAAGLDEASHLVRQHVAVVVNDGVLGHLGVLRQPCIDLGAARSKQAWRAINDRQAKGFADHLEVMGDAPSRGQHDLHAGRIAQALNKLDCRLVEGFDVLGFMRVAAERNARLCAVQDAINVEKENSHLSAPLLALGGGCLLVKAFQRLANRVLRLFGDTSRQIAYGRLNATTGRGDLPLVVADILKGFDECLPVHGVSISGSR